MAEYYQLQVLCDGFLNLLQGWQQTWSLIGAAEDGVGAWPL